jgi:hypothetical protein
LSGCNQVNTSLITEKNKFVGKWLISKINSENITDFPWSYIFSSDGKFSIEGLRNSTFTNGTWDIKYGKLVMTQNLPAGPYGFTYTYQFSNNYRNLSLNLIGQGPPINLIKQ